MLEHFPHGKTLGVCLCAHQLRALQTPAWPDAASLPAQHYCLIPGGFAAPGPGLSCRGIPWVSPCGMRRMEWLQTALAVHSSVCKFGQ